MLTVPGYSFYILGLLFVGLLIRSDDPRLLGSNKSGPSSGDVSASPFVLIGEYAGLDGFNHFINVIIVVSVMSIGVSGVYGGSRTLTALAQKGYAPNVFTYIDRAGRPTFSVGVILLCGLLGYINLDATGEMVFNWLLALSGLAALFTWGSICLAHIRFRKAWAYHGHTLDEIPFQAIGGVAGSWVGLILCVLVLIASVSCRPRFPSVCWLFRAEWLTRRVLRNVVLQRHLPAWARRSRDCRGLLYGHARAAGGVGVLGDWLLLEAVGLAADPPDGRGHGPT